jgi:hypothetical protein
LLTRTAEEVAVANKLGPVPLPALIEDHVEEHRDLFCRSYDTCLGRAIREQWTSWSCAQCVRFRALRRATAAPAAGAAAIPQGVIAPPSGEGGLGRAAPGPGHEAAPDARTAREACPRPSHALQEERGGVQLRLEAPSAAALFVEAARAVAEVVRGPPLEPRAEWDEEVSIGAADVERLLVAWIGELLRRSLRSNVRFEECEVVYLSERKLLAWVRGVRLAEITKPLGPSPGCHDPSFVRHAGRVTAAPVLDL